MMLPRRMVEKATWAIEAFGVSNDDAYFMACAALEAAFREMPDVFDAVEEEDD